MKKLLILCLLGVLVNAQAAVDYVGELRWIKQIEGSLSDGEAIWFNSNGHHFLSVYTPSEADNNSNRTALIVHDLDEYPDWAQIIQPLHVALNEQGWHTFSIQTPDLANDKEAAQYLSLPSPSNNRVQAAILFLQKQGLETDTIVSHSLGGVMSAHYFQNIRIPIIDLNSAKEVELVLNSIDE
jgi:hypothetical protein